MSSAVTGVLSGDFAYLIGSIPIAVLLTRWTAGVDVRRQGSGHAGATNAMRVAGWAVGLAVLALDLGKGYVALRLAQMASSALWAPALAGALVVAGHCWPLFARFRGGMGMASGGGALLAIWPLGFVLAIGLGSLCQLVIRHSARANVATGILLAPVFWLVGGSLVAVFTAAAVGGVVGIRATSDWNRRYREFWFDRPA